jgi:hypothetical protein
MPLKMSDIELKARLPELPSSVPVFALSAPSLDDRRAAIARLGQYLKLGELRMAEFDHAVVMASAQGDIHYFPASGAVLARDATAGRGQKNELRSWEGVHDSGSGGNRMTLNPDASKRLIAQVQELLEPIRLLGEERASAVVQLQQVAQLDGKGKEIAHGAGRATVKFGYAVHGVPVCGAGAKTLAFAEPGTGAPRITGVFHVWRMLGQATAVKLPDLEQALGAGLLADPELDLYRRAGHKIQITRLDFGYLALPAYMRQSHLFPAFQIEGKVSDGKRGIGFGFARFHHAAPPKAYAEAGLSGPYLTVNPDGIRPLPQPKKLA